ncbi:MAG TPA: hypothetical protein VKG23_07770 [Thermoanaerobaculia bacterium]|nr:hypothetical protein [Thermoanaerobaculia bacterium]
MAKKASGASPAKKASGPSPAKKAAANPVKRVPPLKPGKYADGLPLHEVRYLECKLILRPNHFTTRDSFWDFAKVMKRVAAKNDVQFSTKAYINAPLQIREVLFLDTPDFRLYNNAFILRRRIQYEDGFPIADPEIVFKFRHPDMQVAAETDVRPHIFGDYEIKFKCEALPLKDGLGGTRLLFSHNVQFPFSHVNETNPSSLDSLVQVFPILSTLKMSAKDKVQLVGDTIVEEVLQDIGVLDFGDGISSKANVALWRARGDHRPLIGEFAYQIKFKKREDLQDEAMRRVEGFFLGLQYAAKDWIALGATKTGVVYHLKGNPPHAHE